MAQAIRIGILGAGRPGLRHAEGYRNAGRFVVAAVADRIPARREAIAKIFPEIRQFSTAEELLRDAQVDAVSVCLPNDLHAPLTTAALKSGRHVLCETPPAPSAGQTEKMAAAARKAGRVLMYASQRRFGGAEQAALQAVEKGYAGTVFHARASWMRTRGIPAGTGWFTDRSRSGGGTLIDMGSQMLDLAWLLLGRPAPVAIFGVTRRGFAETAPAESTFDVEDSVFALLRFEGGRSLELSSSWALNQPPRQQGTTCRLYGDKGAVEVYTPTGPLLYRDFRSDGEARQSELKMPKRVLYPAMMRRFHEAIERGSDDSRSAEDAVVLMRMIEAIYRSAESGRSVAIGGRRTVESSDTAPA